ncbi:helix-turn-helix transcriptional regulator [Bailinhaonella thermotolerans]|uniref:helix-turn-helix transcriptional regulator n=1 Tax=Bailinhaonella thermotolerans TaxID=1070861 RepID=UPI00192A39B4|nr:WYL domain-containing protein [Bailinhaonella thermotolerans]
MSSASRLPRLLTLVPYLQAHPGMSVGEVARTFGLSEKQLIDDLQLIWMCGLPGHTPGDLIDVSWDGDEILVSNADTIARPLRLGVDEASALLVALRMLAELPEIEDRDALARVIAKLERAAGDAASAVSSQVSVEVEASPDAMAVVRDALARERVLRLRYYVPGRDETTLRDVDPMRIVVADGRSYLEGWCRRAEAVRLFRLDRMHSVEALEEQASPPPEAEPVDVEAGLFRPSPEDTVVELEVGASGRWVAEYYPCEEVRELGEGRLHLTLRTRDTGWVRRLALRLGDAGKVVAPASLAGEVRDTALSALALYDAAPARP